MKRTGLCGGNKRDGSGSWARVSAAALVVAASVVAAPVTATKPVPALKGPQTYYVSNFNGNDSDCATGTSPQTPLATVDFAVGCATSGRDTIHIEAHDTTYFTYYLLGTLVLNVPVTIHGAAPNFAGPAPAALQPVLDSFAHNFRIIENHSSKVKLTDLVVEGGDAGAANGGGIYNDGGLTLTNVTVQLGYATFGGGIYNAGSLDATNLAVLANVARGANVGACDAADVGKGYSAQGGGIYNDGSGSGGGLTLTNSKIENNEAISTGCGVGGGLYNNGGTVNITASTINHNQATGGYYPNHSFAGLGSANGGGIFNNGKLTVDSTTFALNLATCTFPSCGVGGGLATTAQPTAYVIDSTFTQNQAFPGWGGGIYVSDGAALEFQGNNTISGNTAYRGGGIYNYGFVPPVVQTATGAGTVFLRSGSQTTLSNNSPSQCSGVAGTYKGAGSITPACPDVPNTN